MERSFKASKALSTHRSAVLLCLFIYIYIYLYMFIYFSYIYMKKIPMYWENDFKYNVCTSKVS